MRNHKISLLFILSFSILISLVFLSSCGSNEPVKELPLIYMEDSLIILEGNTEHQVLIDIRLSFPSSDTVFFFAKTEDGTATAGEDYKEINTVPLFMESGALRVVLPITIYGDNLFEEDEWFTLTIFGAKNAEIEKETMVIVLLNDDIDNSFRIPETGYTTPTSYPDMSLIWADEFDRESWDGTYWTFEFGGGGWGNNELQYYRDKNVFFEDGHMVIEARRENFGGRAYTSSRIITENKFDFQYGRVDIRAATPFGQGIWPALWMLGANFRQVGWPRCGEIDIMEMIGGNGRERTVHGTAHWQHGANKADFGGSYMLPEGTLHDKFHVFSIIWDENNIRWLIDDRQYHQMAITDPELSEFRAPFFFIFNVAVGGNWPGNPNSTTLFPQRMIVDYIRVFQPE